MRALGPLLLAAAGCFSPSLGDRPFKCGSGEPDCPPSYTCQAGTCRRAGGDTVDGATVDALADGRPGPDGFMCSTAGTFVACKDSDTAFVCDGQLAVIERECPAGCDPSGHLCKQCMPSKTSCVNDALITCTADGEIGSSRICPVGCNATGPACFVLAPSNVANGCDGDATALSSLHVTDDTRIDTSVNASCDLIVPQGATAPELCVLRRRDVTIDADAKLTVRGGRALVIIAVASMTLNGAIDAAARGNIPGPGARSTFLVGRGQSAGPNTSLGGGGGGFATMGGTGGATADADETEPGGSSFGTAALVPLLGGGFGGAGGYPCATTPCATVRDSGGGGGGALQLVACTDLRIGAAAVIDAGGGGGAGGAGGVTDPLPVVPGGGDGGGAGGGVLIEAPAVTLLQGNTIVANGGAGGGGGALGDLNANGKAGQDGQLADQPAKGGDGAGGDAGGGGEGGAVGKDPTKGDLGNPTGGGGGGSVGRVRINTRPDRPVTLPVNAILSPTPTTGSVGRK